MDEDIQNFISSHFILTLCTKNGKNSYCSTVYYLFFDSLLFFLSDKNTRHSKNILRHPVVAVSIFKYTRNIKEIQGIQMMGICYYLMDTGKITSNSIFTYKEKILNLWEIYNKYIEKFPEAKNISSSLWGIFPYWLKFTNNQIQFGYKKIWRNRK